MAENSKIEWTKHTANLWWGCTEVHAGCDNCYARVFSHRYDGGNSLWGNDATRRVIRSVWGNLDKFQRLAKEAGEVHRVFVGSMMDIFEKPMSASYSKQKKEWQTETGLLRYELFDNIDRKQYENLMFLLLTKRPSNINKYIPDHWKQKPPSNVMFGTSIVDMDSLLTLGTQLIKVNGKKFFSFEPQLNWLHLKGTIQNNDNKPDIVYDFSSIDWVIQGGESGGHKRPFDLAWARSMRDQCAAAGVPYFFKQIDKVHAIPEDLQIRQFPK